MKHKLDKKDEMKGAEHHKMKEEKKHHKSKSEKKHKKMK
jgi:hypothetical protein